MQIFLFKSSYETFYFFVDIDLINPLVSHGLDFTFIFLRDNFLNGARRSAISLIVINTFKMSVPGFKMSVPGGGVNTATSIDFITVFFRVKVFQIMNYFLLGYGLVKLLCKIQNLQ